MDNTEHETLCTCDRTGSRRPFLKWLWGGLVALFTVELGWIVTTLIESGQKGRAQKSGDELIDAGTIDQFEPGQVKAVPQGQFYLSRLEDGSFIALSRVCTHLGCAVPWNSESQAFVCPCHGSTFDRRGQATKQPATRPLDYYPVKIENGLIRVNIAKPVKRDSFSSSQTAKV